MGKGRVGRRSRRGGSEAGGSLVRKSQPSRVGLLLDGPAGRRDAEKGDLREAAAAPEGGNRGPRAPRKLPSHPPRCGPAERRPREVSPGAATVSPVCLVACLTSLKNEIRC